MTRRAARADRRRSAGSRRSANAARRARSASSGAQLGLLRARRATAPCRTRVVHRAQRSVPVAVRARAKARSACAHQSPRSASSLDLRDHERAVGGLRDREADVWPSTSSVQRVAVGELGSCAGLRAGRRSSPAIAAALLMPMPRQTTPRRRRLPPPLAAVRASEPAMAPPRSSRHRRQARPAARSGRVLARRGRRRRVSHLAPGAGRTCSMRPALQSRSQLEPGKTTTAAFSSDLHAVAFDHRVGEQALAHRLDLARGRGAVLGRRGRTRSPCRRARRRARPSPGRASACLDGLALDVEDAGLQEHVRPWPSLRRLHWMPPWITRAASPS